MGEIIAAIVIWCSIIYIYAIAIFIGWSSGDTFYKVREKADTAVKKCAINLLMLFVLFGFLICVYDIARGINENDIKYFFGAISAKKMLELGLRILIVRAYIIPFVFLILLFISSFFRKPNNDK